MLVMFLHGMGALFRIRELLPALVARDSLFVGLQKGEQLPEWDLWSQERAIKDHVYHRCRAVRILRTQS